MARITTPFGFHSTAAEVADGIDLSGKRAIVTGASSGIGAETARALAGTGAAVTLAVRDTEAGARVAHEIAESTGNDVAVVPLELTDRGSIAAFVAAWDEPLHVLVANAGVMALPELGLSPEGFAAVATNHLGHFELAVGLHEALAADGAARVVSVSSSAPTVARGLRRPQLPLPTVRPVGGAVSRRRPTCSSPSARRRGGRGGITANSLMPGAILTKLQRHVGDRVTMRAELQKTIPQGAATSVLLATSPLLEGIGGRYFVDCNEAEVVERRTSDMTGVAPYALDQANADRLWELSLGLLGA